VDRRAPGNQPRLDEVPATKMIRTSRYANALGARAEWTQNRCRGRMIEVEKASAWETGAGHSGLEAEPGLRCVVRDFADWGVGGRRRVLSDLLFLFRGQRPSTPAHPARLRRRWPRPLREALGSVGDERVDGAAQPGGWCNSQRGRRHCDAAAPRTRAGTFSELWVQKKDSSAAKNVKIPRQGNAACSRGRRSDGMRWNV